VKTCHTIRSSIVQIMLGAGSGYRAVDYYPECPVVVLLMHVSINVLVSRRYL